MATVKARDRWGVRWKKIRRSIKFFVILAAVAIYLNIGWAFGTYYTTHIFQKTPQTLWQVIWGGGYNIWGGANPRSELSSNIIYSLAWPILVVLITGGSWLVYGLHQLGWLIFHLALYLLWLVGWGGIAKLIGVG